MDYNKKLSKNMIIVLKNLHRFIYDSTDGDIPFELDEYADLLEDRYFDNKYSDDLVLPFIVDTIVASTVISNDLESMSDKELSELVTKFIDKYKIK